METEIVQHLVIEDFEQWLLTKEPNEVVGNITDTGNCPLYNFVYSITGNEDIRINITYCFMKGAYLDDSMPLEPTPYWAERYQIDMIYMPNNSITTQQSLEWIEQWTS